MISKIITERICEYDENGNLTREIEKTTEEYSHDYITDRSGLWSTIPPQWWIDGPTCDVDSMTYLPHLPGGSLACGCGCDCLECDEEDCGW